MRFGAILGASVSFLFALPTGQGVTGQPGGTGGQVVYVHQGLDDAHRLWRVDPNSETAPPERLRLGRDFLSSPQWSSDGRRLVYLRASGIYAAETASADPSNPHFLPPRRIGSRRGIEDVDWSPDSTVLIETRGDYRDRFCTDLYTVPLGDSAPRRLTKSRGCERRPAWSPDGRRIAFERGLEDTTQIVITDNGGRHAHVVGHGSFAAWAPDARSLAFLAAGENDPYGLREIEVVDSRSGDDQKSLAPDAPYDEVENGLTWSPDGRRLAFGFHDPQETFPLTHLATIDADGSNSDRLTWITTLPDTEPDWQPLCTQYGTNGDDVLTGTPGDDVVCGLRGNDRLRGLGGHDVLLGGDGDDILVGGAGEDWLFGAFGDDRLYARDGELDVVNGGPGVDRGFVDGVDQVSELERR